MKLVLDTNIFISSFFWGGNPRKIITRIIDGIDILFVSNEILREVFFVMSRPKFNVNNHQIMHFIDSIEEIAYRVPTLGTIQGVCRDSDDDKILECAVWGNVDFIISGDNDLLSLKEFQEIPIITASEYINKIEKN
ncbi:MAG: putative toxin-antitoxin system toxin component, PIN family [Bacteroidales bacterium]|nr:putative toxin-antitoxin system toxin component, PIN family [Bacteroidales bacterium]